MSDRVNADILNLAITDECISTQFARSHYQKNREMPRRMGMVSFLCVVGILCNPSNANVNVHAYFPQAKSPGHEVVVTAYTNVPECTDSTPNETASLLQIRPKHYWRIIALSPDLARKYKFGDKFHLWINGNRYLVEFQDLMPPKHKNKIDFLLPSVKKCMRFGVNKGVLIPVERPGRKPNSRTG